MASIKRMEDQDQEKVFFIIKNVRVSYPHLFKKAVFEGKEQARGFGISALLDPVEHADAIEVLQTEIDKLVKSELKIKKLPNDKKCLRDGDEFGKEDYEGLFVLKASESTPPLVMGKGSIDPVDEENSPIYAGCYANIKINLWAMNNKWGKRVNANLQAVQFAGDGEPLANSTLSAAQRTSGFDGESLSGEDEFDI